MRHYISHQMPSISASHCRPEAALQQTSPWLRNSTDAVGRRPVIESNSSACLMASAKNGLLSIFAGFPGCGRFQREIPPLPLGDGSWVPVERPRYSREQVQPSAPGRHRRRPISQLVAFIASCLAWDLVCLHSFHASHLYALIAFKYIL